MDHLAVLFHRRREDEDVVQVYNDRSCVDLLSKDLVHHPLERRRRVGEPEEHDRRLEQSTVRPERCLPLVSFLHVHVVVSPSDVHLGEDLCALELIDELLDQWQWVTVLDRELIEFPVILDGSQLPIFLFDEKEWRSHQRDRWSDPPRPQIFFQEIVQHLLLLQRQGIDLAVHGSEVWRQLYGVVPWSARWKLIELFFAEDVWILGDVAFWAFQYLLWLGLDSVKSVSVFVSFLPVGIDIHGKQFVTWL